MREAFTPSPSGYRSGSARQRAFSASLSAGIVVLVLLAAIYQTQIAPRLDDTAPTVTSFDVEGEQEDKGEKAAEEEQEEAEEDEKPAEREVPERFVEPVEVPPEKAPTAPQPKPAYSWLKMSSADMAAADIGKMSAPAPTTGKEAGGGKTYGPGEGPGGAVLYNAEWYRPPTNAELASYLPPERPDEGYGLIACQTIADYRVENCQILGESPRGSGFGRAVLNAAWQFRVKPPKINGKPQLGEWVRIRIDYGIRRL